MRSKLFVPGSRPEFFAKALAGDADALSFDLEDSVTEARKPQARQALQDLLCSPTLAAQAMHKTLIVRVNALGSPHFADDLAAVVRPGLHLINLPKPGHADEVRQAARAIAQAERDNGFREGVDAPVRLLVNIETPMALRMAADLAGADPRVAGLQLGLGDLFEPLGIDRRDEAAVHQVMLGLRLAAGEAGVFAMDAVFGDIGDSVFLVAEARRSRRLGFIGKSCIHPSQVAPVNAVFMPQPAEIERALQVLRAAEQASGQEVGAFTVKGRMIDAPFVASARRVVAEAIRLGLIQA